MLSVSCDVAYLLFTITLWSGLYFLEWESLEPPISPIPLSCCLPAHDSLQTQTQS